MGKFELNDEDLAQTTARAYERLRAYSDRTLAQIAIAERAAGVAEDAINMIPRDGGRAPLRDIDAASQLVYMAEKLLESTVLAARIEGHSWDAIGRAVTSDPDPTRRHAQSMINKYGALEPRWKRRLLEPVNAIHDGHGSIVSIFERHPTAVSTYNMDGQAPRLQKLLDDHRPGTELGLPEDTAAARQGDYLWRLKAATEEYGLSNIPTQLAADIDARKDALATDDRTDETPEETR